MNAFHIPTQPQNAVEAVPEVEEVYSYFAALCALANAQFAGELGGRLILYTQFDAEGAAIALAGNISGAAALGVDADGERLKQGIRQGFCDFLVNNLDEALRILKNEVRKKQPVSVALHGDPATVLAEIVARGVQPDILAASPEMAAPSALAERGAVFLEDGRLSGELTAELRTGVSWTAPSAPALWLPKVDALAASVLPNGDERLRWLKLAPRYLGRLLAVRRYVAMDPNETNWFEALVKEAIEAGTIGVSISVDSHSSPRQA